ncbi:MAG TPA: hypothetical protein VGM23_08075, partial [Armatimonadota bacterium]
DHGTNPIFTTLTGKVAARHNNGAVLAYADGHTGWLNKFDATSGVTYAPSMVNMSDVVNPEYMGPVFASPVVENADSLAPTLISKLNTPILMAGLIPGTSPAPMNVYFSTTTATGTYPADTNRYISATPSVGTVAPPSWLQLGTSGTKLYAAGATTGSRSQINWGNQVVPALVETSSGAYGPVNTTIVFVPTANQNTAKKVAFIVCNRVAEPWAATATITSIQLGTNTPVTMTNCSTSLVASTGTGKMNALGLLLPVKTGQNITVNMTFTTQSNGGMSFAFEP